LERKRGGGHPRPAFVYMQSGRGTKENTMTTIGKALVLGTAALFVLTLTM
jgi:hypothetical protein